MTELLCYDLSNISVRYDTLLGLRRNHSRALGKKGRSERSPDLLAEVAARWRSIRGLQPVGLEAWRRRRSEANKGTLTLRIVP